jgi:plasmid stabilization system protein ParE
MQIVPHPLVERNIVGLAEHVHPVTGDGEAARRRILEVRALLGRVRDEPDLGAPLPGELIGWRVRHGGLRRQISIVYRHDVEEERLYIALVAFGGQDGPRHGLSRPFPAP